MTYFCQIRIDFLNKFPPNYACNGATEASTYHDAYIEHSHEFRCSCSHPDQKNGNYYLIYLDLLIKIKRSHRIGVFEFESTNMNRIVRVTEMSKKNKEIYNL